MAGAVAVASVAALFLSLAGSVDVAEAATFTVEDGATVEDDNPGDGVCRSKLRPGTLLRNCTLMAAVDEANSLPGFHTIILPPGTYRFERLNKLNYFFSLEATPSDMVITGQMNIVGAGASVTEIKSGGGLFTSGILVAPGGRLRLFNVTYRDSDTLKMGGTELLVSNSVLRDNQGVAGAIAVDNEG
jgi:hypothetical protein